MGFTQLRYSNHSGKVNLQTASLYSYIVLVNQDNQLMIKLSAHHCFCVLKKVYDLFRLPCLIKKGTKFEVCNDHLRSLNTAVIGYNTIIYVAVVPNTITLK